MDRSTARRILLIAFGIGVTSDVLFDGPAVGINAVVLVAVILIGAWLVRRPDRAPDPVDAWLPVAALVLGGLAALRSDPFLIRLDLLGAAAFTGASIAAFSGLAVTRRSASMVAVILSRVLGATAVGGASVMHRARPPRESIPRRAPAWVGPLGRGLLLSIPLVLIFVVLFASADPIFREGLERVVGFRLDLGDLPGRVVFILAATWFAAGLLLVAATGIPAAQASSLGAAARTTTVPAHGSLGSTEAVIVLIAVDAIVASFVGLQIAYLFGGLDTIAAAGLTYSDYARRGYFELVAAAGLAGGILVGLDYAVARRPRTYLALGVGLVALTVVVLASAALRLALYQDAYGWTELRFYVAVSIAAMALTLVVLAAFLVADRTRWLGHVMVVTGLAALLAVNAIAPPAFVAARDLDRVIDPTLVPPDGWVGLDVDYLGELSDDAIPTIVAALPRLPEPDAAAVRRLLDARRSALAADAAGSSPAAWNLGREQARAALSTLP